MTKLRKDIFTTIEESLENRENTLNMWINEAFEAVNSLFPSKEKFIEYVNLFRNPRDAELFIRLCQFYLITKKYVKVPSIKLIMIISIIERLARRERKYIPFQDWVFGQDEKYNVIYQIMKK